MVLPTNWVDGIGMSENAEFLNTLGVEVNANTAARPQSGLFASCPVAGNPGRLYYATDARIVLWDNGVTWDTIGGDGRAVFTPPPTGGWTTTTLGSSTVAADLNGRLMAMPSAATTPVIEYQTLTPASPFTATVCIEGNTCNVAGTGYYGMFLRLAASGRSIFFGVIDNGIEYVQVQLNTTTTANTVYVTRGNVEVPRWLRIRDDAASRFYEYSRNGLDWVLILTHVRATGIIPDQVGWGGANVGGTAGRTVFSRLLSWSVA